MLTKSAIKSKVENMSCDAIDSKPVDADWSEGFGEAWECWEASRCDKCKEIVIGNGNERHRDVDSETECDGYIGNAEGPMMNYYYPCPIEGVETAAKLLVDLPLCVVLVNGETGLALTGGGMDLSWSICEAFVTLGMLPPVHFASQLPAMAGMKLDDKTKLTLAACRRSIEVSAQWAARGLERLNDLEKELRATDATDQPA